MPTVTFVNAKVFTGCSETDFASAFRITDGAFDWVGLTAELDGDQLDGAVDLGGATVTPGFIDAHTHPVLTATLAGATMVLPPAVSSIEELVEALTRQPPRRVESEWILGFGYDEAGYPERRKPNRHDLDRVSTTQPVLVHRCDGHSAVCNTRALELAGVTLTTLNPEGGRFERDPDGTPNGVLTEFPAVNEITRFVPKPSPDDVAETIAELDTHYLSEGIVGICDLLATMTTDPIATVRLAERKGFRPQCGLFYGWREALTEFPRGPPEHATHGRVHMAGLKLFADGAFSDNTAWCKHPHPRPHPDDTVTALLTTTDILRAVEWARRNRMQLAFHAMGDRATQQLIDVLGPLQPWTDDVPSVRIDHATLISADMLTQISEARMSFAVISHTIFYFAEYDSYRRNLSPGLADEAYPIARYYHSHLPTALASDAPATAWARADHVFTSIRAAVVRRSHTGGDMGLGQSITLPQALLLYTGRAAQVSRFTGLGRIQEGYEGSFVVLEPDPFTLPSDELDRVEVAQTWLRGHQVYTRRRTDVHGNAPPEEFSAVLPDPDPAARAHLST